MLEHIASLESITGSVIATVALLVLVMRRRRHYRSSRGVDGVLLAYQPGPVRVAGRLPARGGTDRVRHPP
jgi:hypothetical protein